MRYVILGAGAIGGAIGGRLHQSGLPVTLIARGDHYRTLAERGLELRDPNGTEVLDIPVADSPSNAKLEAGDVVILATKSQQSEAALADLYEAAPPGGDAIAVVCAQNGVDNERMALRRFARTYGMRVILAGTHLEPGVVVISTSPVSGILDLGRYPRGTDTTAEKVAEDLRGAGFDSEASSDVMSHKYLKLLMNLANAIEAACGTRTDDPVARDLAHRARVEARACYTAAGIEIADDTRDAERRRARGVVHTVAGETRAGGSSWQSLTRATGNIEADFLNGEIVLLGRLHGVPTPVNERLQRVADDMARDHIPPGTISAAELADGLPPALEDTPSPRPS